MRSPLDTSTLVLAGVAVVTPDGGGSIVGRPDASARAPGLASLAGVVTPGGLMVIPSLAVPVIAGWLVSVFNHE